MKKEIKLIYIVCVVSVFMTGLIIAQHNRQDMQRPSPPLFSVLDRDGDRIISSSELLNSAQLLKTLDKNNDGLITHDELRSIRGVQNNGLNNRRPKKGNRMGSSEFPNNSSSGNGLNRDSRGKKKPPLFSVLDSDGDNKISEVEILNAQNSLSKLDTNGDGQISHDEIKPKNNRGKRRRN